MILVLDIGDSIDVQFEETDNVISISVDHDGKLQVYAYGQDDKEREYVIWEKTSE